MRTEAEVGPQSRAACSPQEQGEAHSLRGLSCMRTETQRPPGPWHGAGRDLQLV